MPNMNRSFHFPFFSFWRGGGFKTESTKKLSPNCMIQTGNYVMADILRRNQYKVAEGNKQNNANLSFVAGVIMTQDNKRQNMNSFELGFPEEYRLCTHTCTHTHSTFCMLE